MGSTASNPRSQSEPCIAAALALLPFLLLACFGSSTPAQDDAGGTPARIAPFASADDGTGKVSASVKPAAYTIMWSTYRTVVVIEASAGKVKPAWIVTYAAVPDEVDSGGTKIPVAKDDVVVAYRGQAFLDSDGVLHIDATGAKMTGLLAQGGWSPDSFSITSSLSVSTHDDNPDSKGETGQVDHVVYPSKQANDSKEYQEMLLTSQAIVEGDI